ncbi:MAG TPA: divalent-cation tolerance protein CutA [Candidatus Bathyarchaeia archaeon]|nr:divalent-cation tolerance protein CutA [Candidatus Bathyarchaeia archaeon]
MKAFIQISTATNSKVSADKIAKNLLQERLAACVQVVGPIHTSYWWNGKLEHAKEWLCLVKARLKDYPRIEGAIRRAHPYEIPEVLASPIVQGSVTYLRWLQRETYRKRKAS